MYTYCSPCNEDFATLASHVSMKMEGLERDIRQPAEHSTMKTERLADKRIEDVTSNYFFGNTAAITMNLPTLLCTPITLPNLAERPTVIMNMIDKFLTPTADDSINAVQVCKGKVDKYEQDQLILFVFIDLSLAT